MSVAKSAAQGAALGSLVPGVGTTAGAAIGGVIGAVGKVDLGGIFGTSRDEKRKRRDNARAFLESAGLRAGAIKDWHSDKYGRFEAYVRLAKVYGYPVIEAINSIGDPSTVDIENYLKRRGILSPAAAGDLPGVAFGGSPISDYPDIRADVAGYTPPVSIGELITRYGMIIAAAFLGFILLKK